MRERLTRALGSARGAALIGLLALALVLLVRELGWLTGTELSLYDALVRRQSPPDRMPAVALVEVSEDDIEALGGGWPLSDDALATLVEAILAYEPAAVGLDIVRDDSVPPGEERFRELLLREPRIVAAMSLSGAGGPGFPAPEPLRGSARVGFIDVVLDDDGIVRRGLLFIDDGSTAHFALSLRLAMYLLAPRGVDLGPDPRDPQLVRIGPTSVRPLESEDGAYVRADDRGYQYLLDYRDRAASFDTVSALDIVERRLEPERLQGKVVIVGISATGVKDLFLTPLDAAGNSDVLTPGVMLHARQVSQIVRWGLDGAIPTRTLGSLGEALFILVGCALGATIGYRARSWLLAVTLGAASVAALVGVGLSAFTYDWWLPVAPAVGALLLAAGLVGLHVTAAERRERSALMDLFARHVSPELADVIWRERDLLGRSRGQRLTATVLFSDLKGFTTIAERFEPDELMAWLNEYMEAMAPIVVRHRGVVLRFFGDAIFAAFGIPIPRASESEIAADARNAARAAIDMSRQLVELNAGWRSRGLPEVAMRIGLYTGEIVGGTLGSRERLEYKVQGDAVNVAQRLESLDKKGFVPSFPGEPHRILAGEPTVALLGNAFPVEPKGELQVRGRDGSVRVYRILVEP